MSTITLDDGPIEPDSFHWQGTTYSGMRPTSWRLLLVLWTCRNRTAHLEDLATPVFELHNPPERHQYAPAASRANAFFRWHELPFSVRSRNRHLQLIHHPE